MIGRERDGVRQQSFDSLITGYIDSTSLAQPRVAAHQEYKSQRGLSVRDFQSRISATAENSGIAYLAVFAG